MYKQKQKKSERCTVCNQSSIFFFNNNSHDIENEKKKMSLEAHARRVGRLQAKLSELQRALNESESPAVRMTAAPQVNTGQVATKLRARAAANENPTTLLEHAMHRARGKSVTAIRNAMSEDERRITKDICMLYERLCDALVQHPVALNQPSQPAKQHRPSQASHHSADGLGSSKIGRGNREGDDEANVADECDDADCGGEKWLLLQQQRTDNIIAACTFLMPRRKLVSQITACMLELDQRVGQFQIALESTRKFATSAAAAAAATSSLGSTSPSSGALLPQAAGSTPSNTTLGTPLTPMTSNAAKFVKRVVNAVHMSHVTGGGMGPTSSAVSMRSSKAKKILLSKVDEALQVVRSQVVLLLQLLDRLAVNCTTSSLTELRHARRSGQPAGDDCDSDDSSDESDGSRRRNGDDDELPDLYGKSRVITKHERNSALLKQMQGKVVDCLLRILSRLRMVFLQIPVLTSGEVARILETPLLTLVPAASGAGAGASKEEKNEGTSPRARHVIDIDGENELSSTIHTGVAIPTGDHRRVRNLQQHTSANRLVDQQGVKSGGAGFALEVAQQLWQAIAPTFRIDTPVTAVGREQRYVPFGGVGSADAPRVSASQGRDLLLEQLVADSRTALQATLGSTAAAKRMGGGGAYRGIPLVVGQMRVVGRTYAEDPELEAELAPLSAQTQPRSSQRDATNAISSNVDGQMGNSQTEADTFCGGKYAIFCSPTSPRTGDDQQQQQQQQGALQAVSPLSTSRRSSNDDSSGANHTGTPSIRTGRSPVAPSSDQGGLHVHIMSGDPNNSLEQSLVDHAQQMGSSATSPPQASLSTPLLHATRRGSYAERRQSLKGSSSGAFGYSASLTAQSSVSVRSRQKEEAVRRSEQERIEREQIAERSRQLAIIASRLKALSAPYKLAWFTRKFVLCGRAAAKRRELQPDEEAELAEFSPSADLALPARLEEAGGYDGEELAAEALALQARQHFISLDEWAAFQQQTKRALADRRRQAMATIVVYLRRCVSLRPARREVITRRILRQQLRAISVIELWWCLQMPQRRDKRHLCAYLRHRQAEHAVHEITTWKAVGLGSAIIRRVAAGAVARVQLGLEFSRGRLEAQRQRSREALWFVNAKRGAREQRLIVAAKKEASFRADLEYRAAINIQKVARGMIDRKRTVRSRILRHLDPEYPLRMMAKRIQSYVRRFLSKLHFSVVRTATRKLKKDAVRLDRCVVAQRTLRGFYLIIRARRAVQIRIAEIEEANRIRRAKALRTTSVGQKFAAAKRRMKMSDEHMQRLVANMADEEQQGTSLHECSELVRRHVLRVAKVDRSTIPRIDLEGNFLSNLSRSTMCLEKDSESLDVKMLHRLTQAPTELVYALSILFAEAVAPSHQAGSASSSPDGGSPVAGPPAQPNAPRRRANDDDDESSSPTSSSDCDDEGSAMASPIGALPPTLDNLSKMHSRALSFASYDEADRLQNNGRDDDQDTSEDEDAAAGVKPFLHTDADGGASVGLGSPAMAATAAGVMDIHHHLSSPVRSGRRSSSRRHVDCASVSFAACHDDAPVVSVEYSIHQKPKAMIAASVLASRVEQTLLMANTAGSSCSTGHGSDDVSIVNETLAADPPHATASTGPITHSSESVKFSAPYAAWSSAKRLLHFIFEESAVIAWRNIFSHTAMDEYKQSMLASDEAREERLARVAHRNGVILSCYDKPSETEWLVSAKKNIGAVSKVYYPQNCDDQDWMRQAYEFTVDFIFQCFPAVSSLPECPEHLLCYGIYALLVQVFHSTDGPCHSSSSSMRWKSTILQLIQCQVERVVPSIPQSIAVPSSSSSSRNRAGTASSDSDSEGLACNDDEEQQAAVRPQNRPESRLKFARRHEEGEEEEEEEGSDTDSSESATLGTGDGHHAEGGDQHPMSDRTRVDEDSANHESSGSSSERQEEGATPNEPAAAATLTCEEEQQPRPPSCSRLVSKADLSVLACKLSLILFDVRVDSSDVPLDCA